MSGPYDDIIHLPHPTSKNRPRMSIHDRAAQFSPFAALAGYEAAMRLLGRADDLTAIFAFGDVIALGALRAATDRGLRIPLDISLVGFDCVDVSQYSVPRLTTVRQDAGLLARRGVEALIAAARGDKAGAVHESVPFRLLRRESVLSLAPASVPANVCAKGERS